MKRRYGKFSLPAKWVRISSPEITRIMGACSIFRAEHMLISDRVEYMAHSFRFREIEEGEIAPEYQWFFTSAGDMWCEEVQA